MFSKDRPQAFRILTILEDEKDVHMLIIVVVRKSGLWQNEHPEYLKLGLYIRITIE